MHTQSYAELKSSCFRFTAREFWSSAKHSARRGSSGGSLPLVKILNVAVFSRK